MAKLPIITLPDPILRKLSTPVERVDDELRKLADDMLETMYAAPGVGLAAVQVGVPRRLVVLDVADEDDEDLDDDDLDEEEDEDEDDDDDLDDDDEDEEDYDE